MLFEESIKYRKKKKEAYRRGLSSRCEMVPKDASCPEQHIQTVGEAPREGIIWVNACGIAGQSAFLPWASATFVLGTKWQG